MALGPGGLISAYLALALSPLVLAWVTAPAGAGFTQELGSGLALAGFAMLLVQFVLTGRFRFVSGRIGIDRVMRLHQLMARMLTLMLVAHPFVYGIEDLWRAPGAYAAARAATFAAPAFASGVVAWVLLIVLTVFAIHKRRLPVSYEFWRATHGIGALAITLAGLHHALAVGQLSQARPLAVLWMVLAALAALTLAHVYLFPPWALRRRPYRVAEVRAVGPGRWLLALEAEGAALQYRGGQFVWLKFGPHPFTLRENPFSILSAPDGGRRLEFLIREAGDFTATLGTIAPGTRAWVDGPYGAFTLAPGNAPVLLLAGGVGLAPILSLLRGAAAAGDRRRFHLIYGNRAPEQAVMRDAIAALQSRLDLHVDYVVSEPGQGWNGAVGEMDFATLAPLLRAARDPASARYYLCGPPPMVAAALAALARLGVPPAHISAERFDYD